MKYPTIFHLISAISNKAGVVCILIGGFAIGQYAVPRQTFDVDFLTTKENFDKIFDKLKQAGFKLEDMRESFARFSGTDHYLMDIDFMFVDKSTLDKIAADGKEVTIANQKLMIPSISTLIALKLHAIKNNQKLREYKDLFDIINLVRENKVDCKSDKFRKLCLKYGTRELYDKILIGA
jgi:predicted nucleotidyltransferase